MRFKTRLSVSVLIACALTLGAPLARAQAKSFTFTGRGWGHGVGMSQWGAKGLADRGWSMSQILGHFYAGTAIDKRTLPAEIRVGLLQNATDVQVTGNGTFDFYDSRGVKRVSG